MKDTNKPGCKCPFCETELEMKCFEPVFCSPCKTKFVRCKTCGELYSAELKNCPKCSK